MKCLILAAGYATRLYPLTENFPKPLLTVGEKTILDWLIEDIDGAGEVDEYVVISNHKFAPHFTEWAATRRQKITVVDDGTSSNETRLGAVKDIQFAIDKLGLDLVHDHLVDSRYLHEESYTLLLKDRLYLVLIDLLDHERNRNDHIRLHLRKSLHDDLRTWNTRKEVYMRSYAEFIQKLEHESVHMGAWKHRNNVVCIAEARKHRASELDVREYRTIRDHHTLRESGGT